MTAEIGFALSFLLEFDCSTRSARGPEPGAADGVKPTMHKFWLCGVLAGSVWALLSCASPKQLRPVIHANDEDRYGAMKSAPIVVLAEIQKTKVFEEPRIVEKPPGIGGPSVPAIPLYLAEISAKIILSLRGNEGGALKFYSWVWASAKHGGPRLFNPVPGSTHVLFLHKQHGYTHTVGEYPAYDLEIRSRWLPAFISQWNSRQIEGGDLMERIAAGRLRAELESVPLESQPYWLRTDELVGLTSQAFVTSQLDSLCQLLTNPTARRAACEAATNEVSGLISPGGNDIHP